MLLLAAAPGLWRAASYAQEGLESPRVELWPAASAWIRENVSPDAAVISTEPYLVALTTGRRAYFPPPAPSREAWIAALRNAGVGVVMVHRQAERGGLAGDDRDLLSNFNDWAVPSPPLALAATDEPDDILFLRLE